MQGSWWLLGLAEGDPVAPKKALQAGKPSPCDPINTMYTTTESSVHQQTTSEIFYGSDLHAQSGSVDFSQGYN